MRNILLVIPCTIGLLFRKLLMMHINFSFPTLVSTKASIRTKGRTSIIKIGSYCGIRQNVEISATDATIDIGKKCFINRNCMIVAHEKIIIGDYTTIGPGTYIYDHNHDGKGSYETDSIEIGKNVWIGAGCIILKGIKIGDNAVIGAGSLITRNVPSNCVVLQKRNTMYKEF